MMWIIIETSQLSFLNPCTSVSEKQKVKTTNKSLKHKPDI